VVFTRDRYLPRQLHPAQAFFLAAAFAPFLGAVLSDYAYTRTYQVQWLNFSSWLIAGALVFAAIALVCALVDLARGRRSWLYFLLLLVTWVLGFINALIHARDAWATMPTGFFLSLVVVLLAGKATWLGFAGLRAGGAP